MSKEEKISKYSLYLKLIIILITLIAASYAWLTNGTRLKMEGLTISTRAVQNLSFSLDGGITWNDETTLNLDENFEFSSEITGNGIKLYVPSKRRENGTPIAFREATVNHDYIEFEIRFKSDNATGIYLASDSFVEPTAGTNVSDLIGEEVIRKSSSGDFTRDLIAGSVRVAFIENVIDGNNIIAGTETKLVWAPNPNYELVREKDGFSFLLDSTSSQDYSALDTSTLLPVRVENIKDNINASYSTLTTGGDPMLIYMNENEEKSITVRIWVEGNDRETDTSLKGGIFRIYFNFIGISKSLNTDISNVEVIDNHFSSFTSKMEYSKDYGNHWIKYQEDANPTIEDGMTVYVRYQETMDKYPSDYIIINN